MIRTKIHNRSRTVTSFLLVLFSRKVFRPSVDPEATLHNRRGYPPAGTITQGRSANVQSGHVREPLRRDRRRRKLSDFTQKSKTKKNIRSDKIKRTRVRFVLVDDRVTGNGLVAITARRHLNGRCRTRALRGGQFEKSIFYKPGQG